MGEFKSNRPARLTAALSVFAVAGVLLTSCAGTGTAGSAVEPTESAPAASLSATAVPTPVETTATPTPVATPEPSASAEKTSVEPFVTSATSSKDGIDVGALVPKIVESDGTCTASAERDGVTVQRSGKAVAASSYTGCPQLLLKGDQLAPGTWTVTVTYVSDTSAGTSQPKTVTVG
ncbi:hypothetical protein [Amnibacterium endophyticum]|uniref:Uncharacterized protein n=1 Tax=Amnibacterium endophyticum TaxID=2109337 RepID=A0ABW4LFT1_9MICO